MKVFVTGVASGIGKALAMQLVQAGYDVWGIDKKEGALEQLRKELPGKNLSLSFCDIQNIAEMQRVAGEMREKHFIPDIIVLNAGVNLQNPSNTFDLTTYQKAFDVNLRGALFWVSEFVPDFLKRNSGQFIAISSTSAFRHGYGGISYSASKAALSLTFRRLRIHFAKTKVQFSTIYFGPINTELWALWRGPKIPFFIPSAERASRFITRTFKRKSGEYYFPFFTTLLSRLSLLFPESLFIFFSKHLTEKYGGD